MEVVNQLRRQFIEHTTSMSREGYLDDQFTQLQKLQDESNPNFASEVVSLFFENSEKLLNNIANALQKQIVDFQEVHSHVHQFKGSSGSIGAQRVKNVCVAFKDYCDQSDRDGCVKCLQQLNHEFNVVKRKLDTFFELEHRIVAVGGQVPMMT